MARVRVQREAWRSREAATPGRALSSSARLADVVRRLLDARGASLVRGAAREDARGRRRGAVAAADEPVFRPSAAIRARAVLRISPHDAGGTARDRSLVESAAGRHLLRAGVAEGGAVTHRPLGV